MTDKEEVNTGKKIRRRRRKAKKPNNYFTADHEDAIIHYALIESKHERDRLYMEKIRPVFKILIEKVVYSYKMTNIPDIEYLKDECQTFLVTILPKYNKGKGAAFSYFTVVTKNWFFHKKKESSNRGEVNFEQIPEKAYRQEFIYKKDIYKDIETADRWKLFKEELSSWKMEDGIFGQQEAEVVVEALSELFDNIDKLDIINRKSVYLYLRELTKLPTKRIVATLKKLKKFNAQFSEDYNSGRF